MADSLIERAIEATRVVVSIIVFLGALGNGLNILILTSPASNHNTYSLFSCDGYPSDHSNVVCKMISYLLNLCPNISVYLIVFASVYQICCISSTVQQRSFSSVRLARFLTLVLIVLLEYFFISIPITFDLRQENGLGCVPYPDTVFKQVLIVVEVVVFAIIAHCLMMFFGSLTIYNVNQLNVIPITTTHRRTDW
ncbi:unnamed protein product [Rotaria socialis]|uniref:G-protein coupled receptors family 1 profile domain-containing protein n=2 Tax=Rotaria socialis TaxID=392032 RepID=A0A817YQH7_9BILA|nr:unnamed protein product [Rotaria socialis]